MTKYSKEIAEQVRTYLEKEGLKYSFDDEKGIFKFSAKIKDRNMSYVDMFVLIGEDDLRVISRPPIKANDKKMLLVAEYFTRANYGLKYGNFQMDMSDGEVLFKTYLYCGTESPIHDIIDTIIEMPHFMWSEYGDGFLRVLFGNELPKDVIESIEKDNGPPSNEDSNHSEAHDEQSVECDSNQPETETL